MEPLKDRSTDPLTGQRPQIATGTGTDFESFLGRVTYSGVASPSQTGQQHKYIHSARTLYQANSYRDEVAGNIDELFIKLLCESNEDFMSPQLIERSEINRLLDDQDTRLSNIHKLSHLIQLIVDAEGTVDRDKRKSLNNQAQDILRQLGIQKHRIDLADPHVDTDCANRLSSLVTNCLISPDATGNVIINISDETFKHVFNSCPSLTPYLSKKEREALYSALLRDLAEYTDLSMVTMLGEFFGKEKLANILTTNLVTRTREISVEHAYLKDFTGSKDDLAELIRTRFRASHASDFVEEALACMRADPNLNFEKIAEQVNVRITKKIERDVLREAIKLIKKHDFDSSVSQLKQRYQGLPNLETSFSSITNRLATLIQEDFKQQLDLEDDEVKAHKGYGDILRQLNDFVRNQALTILVQEPKVTADEQTFYAEALRRIAEVVNAKLESIFNLKQGDIGTTKNSSVVIARELVDVQGQQQQTKQIFKEIFPRVNDLETLCHEGLMRLDKMERIVSQARFLGRLIRGGGSVLLNLSSINEPHRSYLNADDARKEDAAIAKTIYEYSGTIDDLPILPQELPATKALLAEHPLLPVSKAGWLTKKNSNFGTALFSNLMDAYNLPPEEQKRILGELGAMVGIRPTRRQFMTGAAAGLITALAGTIPFFAEKEISIDKLPSFRAKQLIEELDDGKLDEPQIRKYKILAEILKDHNLVPPKFSLTGQEFAKDEVIVIPAETSRITAEGNNMFNQRGQSRLYYKSALFANKLKAGIEAEQKEKIPDELFKQIYENFTKTRDQYTNFMASFDMDFVFPIFFRDIQGQTQLILVVDSDKLDRLTVAGASNDLIKQCAKGLAFLPKTTEIAWQIHKKPSNNLHSPELVTWGDYQKIIEANQLEDSNNSLAQKLKKIIL